MVYLLLPIYHLSVVPSTINEMCDVQEHRVGIFACAGCSTPLFNSSTKYASGTGGLTSDYY